MDEELLERLRVMLLNELGSGRVTRYQREDRSETYGLEVYIEGTVVYLRADNENPNTKER